MKKLVLLLTLLLSFIIVDKANAYDIQTAGNYEITFANVQQFHGNDQVLSTNAMTIISTGGTKRFWRWYESQSNAASRIHFINWEVPAGMGMLKGIFHVSLRFSTRETDPNPFNYQGWTAGNNDYLMSKNCSTLAENSWGYQTDARNFQCDFWIYHNGYNDKFQLVGEWDTNVGATDNVIDIVAYTDWIQLKQPLDQSSITNLGNQITNAINDLEVTIEGQGGGATPAQIQNAAETAIENARENEKEEYEEQQEDVNAGAEDAGAEAEEATSSLIDTASTIIGVIRDTAPTDCIIQIQIRAFNTGSLNLCHVPQEIRNLISTVITIPITIAAIFIIYTFVTTYLDFIRKEQE